MPYHVRISFNNRESFPKDFIKLDLSKEELENRFVFPYNKGQSIVSKGKTIPLNTIESINVNFTALTSNDVIPIIITERKNEKHKALISDEWFVTTKGNDVTDDFIVGPPGKDQLVGTNIAHQKVQDSKNVFVVHGRNLEARDAIFTFLESIGLHPLEWEESVKATNKTAPYVGEVLDKAFEIAQAVVVLMSPDDRGYLSEEFRTIDDPKHETVTTPQARLNVIFEAGMSIGRCPDRTIIIELGTLRPFSDIAGRHVLKLDNSTQKRQAFAMRLKTAGCPFDIANSTRWQSAGEFEKVIKDCHIAEKCLKNDVNTEEIDESMCKVLQLFFYSDSISADSIARKINIPLHMVRYYIGELLKYKYVRPTTFGINGIPPTYSITQDGRKYIVKNNHNHE